MQTVKYVFVYISFLVLLGMAGFASADEQKGGYMGNKELTPQEKYVIIDKGTERPFTGKYNDFNETGTYVCKRCRTPLYRSDDKFSSHCGWPSFDDQIDGAVTRIPDADGRRTEIVCTNCGAHLGHVFEGERITEKNTRHCVNSISMDFIAATDQTYKKAVFAGGCFWGVEYHFEKLKGVIKAVSGYMGGRTVNPTYEDICYKDTGHIEVVEVTYDPNQVSYEALGRLFFEIHDPTQKNGQGPDIGEQYLSVVFYNNEEERKTAEALIDILTSKGYDVATALRPVETFYRAEEYHQDYYTKKRSQPYCHTYTERF